MFRTKWSFLIKYKAFEKKKLRVFFFSFSTKIIKVSFLNDVLIRKLINIEIYTFLSKYRASEKHLCIFRKLVKTKKLDNIFVYVCV